MYRPSLKSLWTVLALGIISLILMFVTNRSKVDKQTRWYPQKIEAAELMKNCMQALKSEALSRGYEIDRTNDPLMTGLIGPDSSPITTSIGILDEKITALNPNLAAVFVDMMKSAGISQGDKIAVGLTAANPGANIAVYAALEVIGADPTIITSVGSSRFGANREDFTWLDMEKVLLDKKLISFQSYAASLGGGKDIGRGISKVGRELIIDSINRNDVKLIMEETLDGNIAKREELYSKNGGLSQYEMFINIGAGASNVGLFVNAKLIKNGLNRSLGELTFEKPGVFHKFALKKIPIMHLYRIRTIAEKYNLPVELEEMPEIGKGEVYSKKVINIVVASICLAVILVLLILVIIYDRKDRHFLENIVQH